MHSDYADFTTKTCDSNKYLPDFGQNWSKHMLKKGPNCRRIRQLHSNDTI